MPDEAAPVVGTGKNDQTASNQNAQKDQKSQNDQNVKKNDPETVIETKTSIDKLLDILRAKGKSELNNISVALNIDPRIIEKWAKVLESGNLIRITYEVGRMYLEPISIGPEQTANLQTKTDISEYILEEDLAVEKISLEKFSKNIDDLNSVIGNIEKIYRQKLPNVQKIIAEVDRVSTPLEARKRSVEKIKEEADKNFGAINKEVDALYSKLNAFSPKQTESKANERLTQLNRILESIDDTQKTMNETNKEKESFFKDMQSSIDAQAKEIRSRVAASKTEIDKTLKLNDRQLNDFIKAAKEEVHAAKQVSREVDGFRKEFESARRNLDALKKDFADRYERLRGGIEKDTKFIELQSKGVNDAVKAIKDSFGDVSRFDEEIKKWRKNMNDLTREVTSTKADILKLSNQLSALDANKNISIEAKAKALDGLEEEGKKTKDKTGKIRKVVRDTANEMKSKSEGKG